MPRGYTVKKAAQTAIEVSLIEIKDGTDVESALREACRSYNPAILFSIIGSLSVAQLRVPRDECVSEVFDVDDPFGIRIVDEEESKYILDNYEQADELTSPIENIPNVSIEPKPHWAVDTEFSERLLVLYGMGGLSKPTSQHNYHFIVSGSETRPLGAFNTFVGKLLPGCVTYGSMWVVVGAATPFERGVSTKSYTLSIEVGEEIITTMNKFFNSAKGQDIRRSFLWSATGALKSATIRLPVRGADNTSRWEEKTIEAQEGSAGLDIEGMTAIFGGDQSLKIHAAITLPHQPDQRFCESLGGELVSAVVGGELPLDLYIGEETDQEEYTWRG